MTHETTLILCGGPINYSSLPIGTNASNAMVPVNGKPVIGWILDDLLTKGITSATVVLREQDHRLQQFVQRAYARRMQVVLAPLHQEGTIVQSLQAGLLASPATGLVRVILGDTLIRDTYKGNEDFVYVRTVDESRRWCLAILADDLRVIDYLDKQEDVPPPHLALGGYYHLQHGDYFRECVELSVAEGERELSAPLRRYGSLHPIYARPLHEWFDFGNIDNLVDARRRLLKPRYFNTLTINPVLNTITKVSENDQKLREELDWYLHIPDELKVLTPRILSHQEVDGRLHIVQEYYGYPSLSELYVYGDFHADTWVSILRHILRIHAEFRRYPGTLSADDITSVYVEKTWKRLDMVRRQNSDWERLLALDEITYNGRRMRGLHSLEAAIHDRACALAQNTPVSVIHGDFCLSNILFDPGNQIIRLIDPRGSFGAVGIYGDARYDIAKLRHSLCGLYDHFLADMFEIEENAGVFTGAVYITATPRVVAGAFDRLIGEAGYDLEEIRFIEGLLFISMLPLHHGHPHRQRMMFLTGLALLNDVLSDVPNDAPNDVLNDALP